MAKISLFGKTIRDIFTTLLNGVTVLILFTDKSGRDPVLKDAKVLFIVGKIYSPYSIRVKLQFIAVIL